MQAHKKSFVRPGQKIRKNSLRHVVQGKVHSNLNGGKMAPSRNGSGSNASANGSTGRLTVTPLHAGQRPLVEDLAQVVRELHELLESYAPAWYTLEHHNMVEAAVDRLHQMQHS